MAKRKVKSDIESVLMTNSECEGRELDMVSDSEYTDCLLQEKKSETGEEKKKRRKSGTGSIWFSRNENKWGLCVQLPPKGPKGERLRIIEYQKTEEGVLDTVYTSTDIIHKKVQQIQTAAKYEVVFLA